MHASSITAAAMSACRSSSLPEAVDAIGAHDVWQVGVLPPLPDVMIMGELAQAVVDGRSTLAFDEVAYLFAPRDSLAACARSNRVVEAAAARSATRDRYRALDRGKLTRRHRSRYDGTCGGHESFHMLRLHAMLKADAASVPDLARVCVTSARLLTDEGSTITQIAGAVGFADLSNFNPHFRGARREVSPQEFWARGAG